MGDVLDDLTETDDHLNSANVVKRQLGHEEYIARMSHCTSRLYRKR